MLNGRKRLVPALTGLAIVGVIGIGPSGPAQAEPDVGDVQARVDRLFHEAEQASERFNDARIELEELNRDLRSLEADEDRQGERLEGVREQVERSVVRQYQGQGLSAVGQVIVSDDPQGFLSELSTMSAFDDLQDQMFGDYTTELKALDIRRDATEERAAQVAEVKDQLADEKAEIDEKLAEAEGLLDRLEAEEREAVVSRDTTRPPATVPASGRAGAAVAYAMSQVGDAYVYGAAGPSAFDCSGLTMMAWNAAGVSLPHSSSAQYSSGPQVAESDLQPGDLVFYYSPISHVGMYIGGGMIVHAANPGSGVTTAPLHSMPYVGAVRPG
ncbi:MULTISPECIES: NlpC/P60 family protein [unclassified Nocardioides]|uniref:C40 family peptidase n=1 Tax=unclassified Nocardioides TaxID=2615069 RepID=UPI002665762E|nr:NlpC/P60 family protein [Nocardioides sp. Arc9.136]WKN50021.1 NlpC/P60 family protein [Nocardioides sp. Arc9.136]